MLLEATRRPAWHADALCREYPEVSSFPVRGESTATAIRATCLVRAPCLAAALEMGDGGLAGAVGVWGGTSARERLRQLSRLNVRQLEPDLIEAYAGRTAKTLTRDLHRLIEMGFLVGSRTLVRANLSKVRGMRPFALEPV